MELLTKRLVAAGALLIAWAAIAAAPGCSRRAVDPTPVASPSPSGPPPSGSPAAVTLKITYTLGPTLSNYPVAVWIESSGASFVRSLQAYEGNFNYAPGYVLPTWWGAAQGRGASAALSPRPPGTYSVIWDLLDWQGTPQPPGYYVVRLETSNWGLLGTDDLLTLSAPATTIAIGTQVSGGPSFYFPSVVVETRP